MHCTVQARRGKGFQMINIKILALIIIINLNSNLLYSYLNKKWLKER